MNALVPFADGLEEMEAVIIVDVLRRAGLTVTTAALADPTVTASRGTRLVADTTWQQVNIAQADILALPGGAGGAERLRADSRILSCIQDMFRRGCWICAVCAAPTVLEAAGILTGVKCTSHPSVKGGIHSGHWLDQPVVRHGRIITSQGPGTCFAFALQIVAAALNPALADSIRAAMCLPEA